MTNQNVTYFITIFVLSKSSHWMSIQSRNVHTQTPSGYHQKSKFESSFCSCSNDPITLVRLRANFSLQWPFRTSKKLQAVHPLSVSSQFLRLISLQTEQEALKATSRSVSSASFHRTPEQTATPPREKNMFAIL